MKTLRPHQVKAIDMLRHSLRTGHKRPMLQAPCGMGKTLIAAHITISALAKGGRVIFTVPSISLVNQTVEAFEAEGIDSIGVIQASHPRSNRAARVQICTIQSLSKRLIPDATIVLIDESQVMFKFVRDWMDSWSNVVFIGLSGTPWSKGLGKYYDDLLIPITTKELIEQGYLSPFKVYAGRAASLEGVRVKRNKFGEQDYNESDLAKVTDTNELVADVVQSWLKLGNNEPTVCFAVSRVHAAHLAEQFIKAGITAAYLDAFTEIEEREAIFKKFSNGDIKIMCNVGVLVAGVDLDIRCIILARAMKSKIAYVQSISRGIRTAPGKECVARGTEILTDSGLVQIQDITLDHRVWDGVSFVTHSGAVCKGIKPVLSYAGLTATPDHEVMTSKGWVSFEYAINRRIRIIKTGSNGEAIRISHDNIERNKESATSGWVKRTDGDSKLQRVPLGNHGNLQQHEAAAKKNWVQRMQRKVASRCSKMALSKSASATRQVHKPFEFSMEKLRRARDRVQISFRKLCVKMDCRESRYRQELTGGQNRQSRPLRAWEFAPSYQCNEYEQHKGTRETTYKEIVFGIQSEAPGSEVCRQNAVQANKDDDGRRDNKKMAYPVTKTEREVWDIHNSGPLQRYTAEGLLVHNCAIILDHGGCTERLGFVEEIIIEELCDGKPKESSGSADKEKPLPKACSKCSFVKPPATPICPICLHESKRQNDVEHVAGTLVELIRGKKKAAKPKTAAEKIKFYGELKTYARQHNYQDGWISHKFRAYAGVWPNKYKDSPAIPVSMDTKNWITSQAIRHAKSKAS